MKTVITSITAVIIVIVGVGANRPAMAGDRGDNTYYQTMRIKHRAQMGYDNNGQAVYKYITDKDIAKDSSNIANYVVPASSAVQEVYQAVDLRRPVNIVRSDDAPVNIGRLTIPNDNHIKKVRNIVRIVGPIHVK